MVTSVCLIAILLFLFIRIQRRAEARSRPATFFPIRRSGATTRERIAEAGLSGAFNEALRARDIKALVALLQLVDLPYPQSLTVAETIVADPDKYQC